MAQLVKAKRLWAASRKGDARAVAAMLGDKRFSVDVNCAMDRWTVYFTVLYCVTVSPGYTYIYRDPFLH